MMRERVLSTAMRRTLRLDSVQLVDAAGRSRSMKEIARGRVTIVAFGLELQPGGSPVSIAVMNRIAARLAPTVQVVAISVKPRTGNAEALVNARGIRFGAYFDPANDASRAFNAYGFPMYFVVDAAGDLRFAYSLPGQLLAQASVLVAGNVAATR
jgi:cytochrome oxidase Cu insertion factor (SCO1/SenC/PrrC family)